MEIADDWLDRAVAGEVVPVNAEVVLLSSERLADLEDWAVLARFEIGCAEGRQKPGIPLAELRRKLGV